MLGFVAAEPSFVVTTAEAALKGRDDVGCVVGHSFGYEREYKAENLLNAGKPVKTPADFSGKLNTNTWSF